MAEKAKAASEPTEDVGKPIPEEEMRTIFSGPAVASNKIYITISAAGVRLTFCEQQGKVVPPVFRTAVLLSFPDAFALRDLLAKHLEKIEFKQEVEVKRKDDGQKDG